MIRTFEVKRSTTGFRVIDANSFETYADGCTWVSARDICDSLNAAGLEL
jgi:hypothetical protein